MWRDQVRSLARSRDAVVLAHNYQLPEIQDVADHVGDSLGLSRIAAAADASTIVFCGVHFMAETAKILSYDKTVLIPDAARRLLASPRRSPPTAARLEGRAPRRGRRQLRQHDRRGEGRDRHLLHVVERRRCRRSRSPRTSEVLFCPDQFLGAHVQRHDRPARTCTSGWGSATSTPGSTAPS